MNKSINCFVFRTSEEGFVKDELKEGRLRQGWSPRGTSLLDHSGNRRSKEEWTSAYKKSWEEEPSPKRFAILSRMHNMKEDDLVLCPKCPTYNKFTIAVVDKGYKFEFSPHWDWDFGHIVSVKDMREVSHNHNEDSQIISDLFSSPYFWSPVVQVQDDRKNDIISAAKRLLESDKDTQTHIESGDIRKQRLDDMRVSAAKNFIEDVKSWSPQQFESSVKEAFARRGYVIIRSNDFGRGGDADHVLAVPLPGFEDKVSTQTPIFAVQVKHKQGIDNFDEDGVKQLINWIPKDEDGPVVRRVLFSSADGFTPNCKKLAEDNDITLICGTEAGLFMLFGGE